MSPMVVDQSESERRLHRVLYVLKFIRAYILTVVLVLLAVALHLLFGISGLYPPADQLITGLKAQIAINDGQGMGATASVSLVVFSTVFVVAFYTLVYLSITGVWRRTLKVASAILAFSAAFFLVITVQQVGFSLERLSPLFTTLLILYFVASVVIVADVSYALWRTGRTPETSVFRATLDRRLTAGPAAFLNKLLDLPRSPLRSPRSVAAYALAFAGGVLLVTSLTYVISFGGVFSRKAEIEFACQTLSAEACEGLSQRAAYEILLWMAVALVGIKLAGLLQSTSRLIGATSVRDAVGWAGGRYVFYLRPFRTDAVVLPKPKLPVFTRLVTLRPFPARIEEELFDVTDGFLPLVAVGVPGEAARSTQGRALREFLSDEEWQAVVRVRMAEAESIVTIVSDTTWVAWEIRNLFQLGHASKTLFLFDPAARDPAVWDRLAAFLVEQVQASGAVPAGFSFVDRPLGFFLLDGGVVEIRNDNWSTTSYRSAFSYFLSLREERRRTPSSPPISADEPLAATAECR